MQNVNFRGGLGQPVAQGLDSLAISLLREAMVKVIGEESGIDGEYFIDVTVGIPSEVGRLKADIEISVVPSHSGMLHKYSPSLGE